MQARLLKIEKSDLLYFFVLLTAGAQLLTLIWLAANSLAIYLIANKPVPTLVQLADGRAIEVVPLGSKERTSQTVQRFTSDVLTLMFNWSGTLPPQTSEETQSPKIDPGVKLGQESNLLSTTSWQAGFALAEDFRSDFLVKVAELTPRDVFTGNTKAVLIIRHLSEPEQIKAGTWKLQVVGDLVFFNSQDNAGNSIPFNKEVFVRAVEPPSTPLAKLATSLEKTVYGIRQSGLEIYAIRELERNNL